MPDDPPYAAAENDRASDPPAAVVDDHDSPWKEALDLYLLPALALLAPDLHARIDGTVPAQFLDKELQALVPQGKRGRRFVDKLARLRLSSGADAWLLIHVEVERRAPGVKARRVFAWRMAEYRHRIQVSEMRRHGAELPPPLYSLGMLLEGRGVGDRLVHTDEYLGQGVHFTFPVVELEGWRDRWEVLETLAPTNPFAVIIMAQLQANRHRDKRTRLGPKLALVRKLRLYGYDRVLAGRIYRLIDWLIALPEDMEPEFLQAVANLSEEKKMAFVSTAEKWGIKKGMQQGLEQGLQAGRSEGRVEGQADLLLRQIQRRFGPVDTSIVQRIRTAKAAELETWALNVLDAPGLDEVFRA
ncbi:DUF4351 domain-containing protein [Pigmentiphaga daeguensis]|uniref:DUF4351 domain-containing protein n=1 Tax=Pigmentiphaga daeguensis TaxID=414049 RepID=A0ABP3LN92_9BURK